MRMPWELKQAPVIAFGVLALTGGYGLWTSSASQADKLYQSQIASCERVNVLREESNRRIEEHIIDRDVLSRFLVAAVSARTAQWERDRNRSDLDAANEYNRLLDRLETVNFEPVSVVDCKSVVEKP